MNSKWKLERKHVTPSFFVLLVTAVVAVFTTFNVVGTSRVFAAEKSTTEFAMTIDATVAEVNVSPINTTLDLAYQLPWNNLTTLAFYEGRFRSGFRNQIMAFTIVVLYALKNGHGQLLLPSLRQKDTYGTNGFIPFERLWDVPHWNSHYPHLPRLVQYDETLHEQFRLKSNPPWYRTETNQFDNANGTFRTDTPERPYAFGKQHELMGAYMAYGKGNGPYVMNGHRNPAEIRMLQGAMRPNPDLQLIIDDKIQTLVGNASNNNNYMTLHARVEPDMQQHPLCRDKKVVNLTDIFHFLHIQWPEPPMSTIFLPINRQILEQAGTVNIQKPKKTNWIAVNNLVALNDARDKGLWDGRVKVIEFGSNALEGTWYSNKPSTAGAMLNFFVGIGAEIFVGTEVSSYSHDLLATRFYRGYRQNYKYLPDGLHDWTPPGTIDSPGFRC